MDGISLRTSFTGNLYILNALFHAYQLPSSIHKKMNAV